MEKNRLGPEQERVTCNNCSGMGWLKKDCPTCGGSGKVNDERCTTCWERGWIQEDCSVCHRRGVVPRGGRYIRC